MTKDKYISPNSPKALIMYLKGMRIYRESDTFGNEISILDTVLEDYVSCSSSITPLPLLQGRDI